MKRLALLAIFFAAHAFACETPTCDSSGRVHVNTSTAISGNISNSIAGESTSSLGKGGASFATSSATVTESATAAGGGYTDHNTGPNNVIFGTTATQGTAAVTGTSITSGTGHAATGGVAYGTASATVNVHGISRGSGYVLKNHGTATSGNQVGIGYATESNGNGAVIGAASVDASSANGFIAGGIVNACNTSNPTGTLFDTKTGYTLTNQPEVNTFTRGNASGAAFSPFVNGTTGTAYQTATVNSSFAKTK